MAEDLVSRPYQEQLEQIASRKNTIIHLPTGSGKTFIAVCLIRRFRDALQKPWGQGGKRTFFLVNTVPLVDQQKKVIEVLCPVDGVGAYSGDSGVDHWDQQKWNMELGNNQVIVMTCQILSDMLNHFYIRIEDINLLIFDECHHAVDDHPMRLVMKHFESCPKEKQPRVLGLTATLLNANTTMGQVESTLRELETTFHATIATVNELGEVLTYSTNPNESIQYHDTLTPTVAIQKTNAILDKAIEIINKIELPKPARNYDLKLKKWQTDITTDPHKITKAVRNMVMSMKMLLEELGAYGGYIGILAYIILLERLKRKASTQKESELYEFTINQCFIARATLVDGMKNDNGYDKILKHSSQKVLQLLNLLKEYSPNVMNRPGVLLRVNKERKPLSAIIFVQQRFTAKVLYNILKGVIEANPADFDFLKHDFIVGLNANPMKCTREQHYQAKASQKALLMFGQSELNCLISTSVIEEGVDIPQCLLVLRFDPPLEYRSYIQSKGRARSKESNYVIMVNSANKEKFVKNYNAFQRIERQIHKILIGNTDTRDAPTQNDIQELYDEDILQPYVTPEGGRIPAVAASSLLNRYLTTLPHDQFTQVTPAWIHEIVRDSKMVEKRLITIIFPLACPIKTPIKGTPQIALKTAKRSAALEACIKLHQEGELDAVTLLPKSYGVVDFDEEEVKECFQNWPWDDKPGEKDEDAPRPGSKKCVRKHRIHFPHFLDAVPGSPLYYLHIIKLNTAFKEPSESRERMLYNLIKSDQGYGFLTQNPLPKLCKFSTFMTVGEVSTEIHMNYAMIKMDEQMFALVKRFHYFLFDQVLAIAKKFAVYEGEVNCLYVVPVMVGSDGYDIDWDVMQQHQRIPPVDVPEFTERRELCVTEKTYKLKVVTPWYRRSIFPDRYIVSNVLEHMTPNSFLSPDSNQTFADYYSSKYNLEIMGEKNQPLLEVRNISSRMNCLLPRAATINSLTDKQAKLIAYSLGDDKPRGAFAEIFLAEFCNVYEFPGVLWYKATMLPSIIHRLHMLLIAQEFIIEAAADIQYGTQLMPRNEEWAPIQVAMPIAIESLLSHIDEPHKLPNSVDRINQPIFDNGNALPKILSMKESLYQLQMKKISEDFPWEEHSEPIDIERNLATATILDIESYDMFVSQPMSVEQCQQSPTRRVVPVTAAIKPPPINEEAVADENEIIHPGPSRKRPHSSSSVSSVNSCRSSDSTEPKKKKVEKDKNIDNGTGESDCTERYVEKIGILQKTPKGRGPELRDVLSALTAIKSHDTFCLERAETLGDSFLKFAATMYLFHKFSGRDEGQLTNIKGRLISNRNLYYAGERLNIGGKMKIEPFSPRKDFLVPGFFAPKDLKRFIDDKKIRPTFLIGTSFSEEEIIDGNPEPASLELIKRRYTDGDAIAEAEPQGKAQNAMQCYLHSQAVSDKTVADCVEALIGTYLLSGGIMAAVKLVEWMRIFPAKDKLGELLYKTVPTVITEKKATPKDIAFLMDHCQRNIEGILGYKFQDPAFLLEAVSHASFIRNRLTRSYERLEFLGDAILDFLITSHIFENSPDLKPGELTDLRSSLVNNVTFASYVVKLGLHKYICKELNPLLDKAIMAFVDHQVARNHEIVEDVLYLIDEEECPMAEYVEVPKTLSDVFESLAGAIYLDCGGNLQTVWSVFYPIMCNEIYEFTMRIPRQPVAILYEMIHACPKFGVAKLVHPDLPGISKVSVPVTFTKKDKMCTVHGIGSNKSQAKRAAAKLALKILNV